MKAAGYFGVWTAGAAWYIAFAELLNETWFRGRVCLLFFYPIPYQELQLWYSLGCIPHSCRHSCLINKGTPFILALVKCITVSVLSHHRSGFVQSGKPFALVFSELSWTAGLLTMLCRTITSSSLLPEHKAMVWPCRLWFLSAR